MGDCVVTPVEVYSIYTSNGRRKVVGIFDVTLSNSYATGGDNLDLSKWFQKVDIVLIQEQVNGSYLLQPVRSDDPSACKIMAYTGIGTEATAGSDLSGVKARIKVEGN